jgi:cation diffusion facilitator CzcD-associated flavoprotein CzcO
MTHSHEFAPLGRHTHVAIIGAGFAGIGMGIRLKRRGEESFRIFERAERIGGTWRDNTYPGIACDVPSHLYSFSFAPNPNWSQKYASGHEIATYLENCVSSENISDHLSLGTDVVDMRWDASAQLWRLETSAGTYSANVLIMAGGRLSKPRIPNVPGATEFTGEWFHSAAWRHDVDLTNKRVGIIGSGASAVQLVPELAELASELVVMQRSAPYVIARDDEHYSEAQRRTFARLPETMADLRARLFWKQEEVYTQRLSDGSAVARARNAALSHLRSQVTDERLVQLLTPQYEIGCKRILISNTYYPAFMRPNVHLQSTALAGVDGNTIIGMDGSRFEVDVLVYATGFHSARQPYARAVFGRDGQSLATAWANGMRGYASTSVHGFPNFFVLNGPNAGLGHSSSIYMMETQIDYVLGALAHMGQSSLSSIEVQADAEQAYVDAIDALSAETVWMNGGCSSWYVDAAANRLTLLWPDFAHAFRAANGQFDASAYASTATRRTASA